jgi:hypothetical protein
MMLNSKKKFFARWTLFNHKKVDFKLKFIDSKNPFFLNNYFIFFMSKHTVPERNRVMT